MPTLILQRLKLFIFSSLSLTLLACGGGGSDAGSTALVDPGGNGGDTGKPIVLNTIAGNWSGSAISSQKVLSTLSLSIAVNNTGASITSFLGVKLPSAIPITLVSGSTQFFRAEVPISPTSTQTQTYGFYIDSSVVNTSQFYMTIITANQSYALLQKAATPLGILKDSDIVNTGGNRWIGTTFETNFSNYLNAFQSIIICTTPLTCSEASPSSAKITLAPISGNEGSFHYRKGSYTDSKNISGTVEILTSANLSYAATFACTTGAVYPNNCSFSGFERYK